MNRPLYNPAALLTRAFAMVGRILLVLAAVELLSMPLTQYVWNWDHFLHGGMDFESSLLFVVICLGLLLVLRHHFRQSDNLRSPRRQFSLPIFHICKSLAIPGIRDFVAFLRDDRTSYDLAAFNLPLQI